MSELQIDFQSKTVKFNNEQIWYTDTVRCQDETWKRQLSKRCFKNDW